ncbi:DNA repair protein XRCC4 [Parambassis ranga]|uniref:DNA repair protein XRCC4 n=1 Tax=Parambassis ranga TaxID=210632 RepID=A0A6P7J9G4_9TELE|nr:DNA repair protein XRCC4-like [Parambassis ranga]
MLAGAAAALGESHSKHLIPVQKPDRPDLPDPHRPTRHAAGMHTSVREIHVSAEPDSSYFLRVDWEGRGLGSGFQLLLTDGQDAWRGEVSAEDVCGEAEELEMQVERYIQDLQQALTESAASYSFTLTPHPPEQGSSVALTYEKMQKDISFRLGCVRLRSAPEPTEAVRELLTHSLQRGDGLQRHNQDLQDQNQRLRREQQRITAELKRYAGGKEALEAELYSRFVLILNEKKAKIRSLQEAVTELQERRSSDRQKKEESDQTAGQDEEYGGSTDEEPPETQPTPASTVPPQKSTTPSPLDDSLSDITDVAPCRKRRFRHLVAAEPAVKKQIPEASQQKKRSDSPAGSSQTPRRSADASAAEDLFDDF